MFLDHCITILTKTVQKENNIIKLVRSVREYYPNVPILVTNEGQSDWPIGSAKNIQIVNLPDDSGLSFARNYMIKSVQTPYVLLLDDDFTVSSHTHLDLLLQILVASQFDLAGLQSEEDMQSGLDFSGLIRIGEKDGKRGLYLERGNLGTVMGCLHKEIVPNLFLAKRESLLKVQWDDRLKLGEHEDFFYRAKQVNLKVLSCPLGVHHFQEPWWDPKIPPSDYFKKRRRVYDFLKIMLKKHGLFENYAFGTRVTCLTCQNELKLAI
jgi:glycosyltransferase involved in cell wall biosynthesis